MKFDKILKDIENGHLAYRIGWKDTNIVWLKPSCEIKAEWCKDPILKRFCENNSGTLYAHAVMCICMIDDAGNHSILTGWNPTAEDMLADDWEIIFNEKG